jgi:small multidrug resistance family-3 protein
VFIVLSLAWGWTVDGHRPDRWDYLGGALCVFGMALIMYGPRSGSA